MADLRKRSVSNENKIMKPLLSVEINPYSPLHPLSHLRSCSEFGPGLNIDNEKVVNSPP